MARDRLMPIIDMPVKMLLDRIPTELDAPQVGVDDLATLLPRLGCEVDEVAEMQEFVCKVCGKIYDRTEAQGPPLSLLELRGRLPHVPRRAREPRHQPGRPARHARRPAGHLRSGRHGPLHPRLPRHSDRAARVRPLPRPSSACRSIRRWPTRTATGRIIACAVVRNVKLDNNTIKMVMNLQEDLHWALGRDRKLASIGVYDLDTLSGECSTTTRSTRTGSVSSRWGIRRTTPTRR
jgi:hypothetical protein